jgi:hypothetical protein
MNGITANMQNLTQLSTQDKIELRDRILTLEEKMKENGCDYQPTINHYFSKGVYAREMRLKKDDLVIGKIHKFENLSILSQGEVSVISIDGAIRIKAPFTFVASPGTKRVILAHEDSVWTVVHGTEETDLDKIEDQFIAKSYEEFKELGEEEVLNLKEAVCLG